MTDIDIVQDATHPTKFTLKFGGQSNDINATTYGTLLINTVTLLEEANKELQTGMRLEIRVKQEREGSWLVDLAAGSLASIGVLSPMLTPENLRIGAETIRRVVSTATSGLEIWKQLKGEKPHEIKAEGNSVVIVTGNNNTIITDAPTSKLVLENKRSQDALSTSFGALARDGHVDSFEVLDENDTPLFASDKTDFSDLAKKPPRLLPDKQSEVESTHLHIIRPSFEPNLNSDFVYRGIRIPASITDEGFWEGIDRGDRFGKGDTLFVDLEISKSFDKTLNTYVNKGYTIVKVHQHIPRPNQPSLLEGEE